MGRFRDALTLGPVRRRRRMARLLTRLDAADRGEPPTAEPWRGGSVQARPAGLGRLIAVVGLIVVLVVAGVIGLRRQTAGSRTAGTPGIRSTPAPVESTPAPGASAPAPDASLPPAGLGAASHRLLPEVTPPAGTGGYTLSAGTAAHPVRYDPCRPIRYVIRDRHTPPGGDELVREAVAAVSAATGLQFVDAGPTSEAPRNDRPPYQPNRYGHQWAPVLIAWSDPTEDRDLRGPTTGEGGSTAVTLSRSGEPPTTGYVTGAVTLDAPQLAGALAREGRATVRAVIEHELGHLVGLNHVADPTQLMYPEARLQVTQYGSGDRRGLALVGAGDCLPQL